MKKSRILLVSSLCLILGNSTSLAGERTEREMLSIAQSQLAKGAKTRSAQTVDKLLEEKYYNVYGNEQSFVIVSREDTFTPVLAYSDTRFDVNKLPCGMQWWLGAINEQMEASTQTSNGIATRAAVSYTPVAPLCKTLWGQDDPYNFLTPELNGRHTPTGCVATAMSQIMKFFEYPAQGKGKGYYTLNGSSSRVPEPINSVYEWDKMLDTYKSYETTDEMRLPVATLMKECGLATFMDYGTSGSGAFSVFASRGFAYNFGYDSLAIHCYYRDFFDRDWWMSTINQELVNGRPILYTGLDPANGGHAFVLDGIDETGKVHINWGWDGECDGYYDIDDLNPVDDKGKARADHFIQQQSMVYGFRCQEGSAEGESYASLWCTMFSAKPYTLDINGKILMVKSPNIYNFHYQTFYGVFGAYCENIDGNPENSLFKQIGQKQNGVPTFDGTDDLNNSIFITGIKPGNYRVYLASKADTEQHYQPVRCVGGAPYYELTVSEDGKTSMSEAKLLPEPTGIQTPRYESRQADGIYDLQGRRHNADNLPKGIYIIGGKKVVK